jgi:hypothetical protein
MCYYPPIKNTKNKKQYKWLRGFSSAGQVTTPKHKKQKYTEAEALKSPM